MTSFTPCGGIRPLRLLASLLLVLSATAAAPTAAPAQALPTHTATGITAGFNENANRSFVRLFGRSGLVRDGHVRGRAGPYGNEVGVLAGPRRLGGAHHDQPGRHRAGPPLLRRLPPALLTGSGPAPGG